jgi:hypothetical protein
VNDEQDEEKSVNQIYGMMKDGVEPAPGVPCTILSYTDRSPAVITRVSPSKATIWIKECSYKAAEGVSNAYSEDQQWVVGEPYPHWDEVCYTRRRNGKYYRKGWSMRSSTGLLIGVAMVYYDPSF